MSLIHGFDEERALRACVDVGIPAGGSDLETMKQALLDYYKGPAETEADSSAAGEEPDAVLSAEEYERLIDDMTGPEAIQAFKQESLQILDGSSELTPAAAKFALRVHCLGKVDPMLARFARYDANGDGKLGQDEVARIVRDVGFKVDGESVLYLVSASLQWSITKLCTQAIISRGPWKFSASSTKMATVIPSALLQCSRGGSVAHCGPCYAGHLEFEEFEKLYSFLHHETADDQVDEVRVQFDKYDDNGDGVLGIEEVTKLIDDVGYKVDEQYAKGVMDVFAKFDDDDSGALEYEEFRSLWSFLMGNGGKSTGRASAKKTGGSIADIEDTKRLRKKFLALNDEYVRELQEHRDDVEQARDEMQTLREELIGLREDVELEREARKLAEELNKEGGADQVMEDLKNIAKEAVAEAEDAQAEAEAATDLAMAFEQEAEDHKRDVEHLTKTVAHLKQVQAKLKFDLDRAARGHRVRGAGQGPGALPGAAFIDNDQTKRMYGDMINDLKKEVDALSQNLRESKDAEMQAKFKLANLEKKLAGASKSGAGGRSGIELGVSAKQIYICTPEEQVFRRPEQCEGKVKVGRLQGRLISLSAAEKHVWGCTKAGQLVMADHKGLEPKGPESDTPWKPVTVPKATEAQRVLATADWVYITTKKDEIFRVKLDAAVSAAADASAELPWERVAGWPILPTFEVKNTASGDITELDYIETDTIADVIKKLADEIGTSVEQLKLTFKGEELNGDANAQKRSLKECKVVKDSCVLLEIAADAGGSGSKPAAGARGAAGPRGGPGGPPGPRGAARGRGPPPPGARGPRGPARGGRASGKPVPRHRKGRYAPRQGVKVRPVTQNFAKLLLCKTLNIAADYELSVQQGWAEGSSWLTVGDRSRLCYRSGP
eukprot:COSAG01_NODE_514_length_16043_cov_248.614212_20_plen_892_part_00